MATDILLLKRISRLSEKYWRYWGVGGNLFHVEIGLIRSMLPSDVPLTISSYASKLESNRGGRSSAGCAVPGGAWSLRVLAYTR